MKNFLKTYFIPHEGNDHRPSALRGRTIDFLFGLALIIEIGYMLNVLVVIPHSQILANVLSSVVVDETNINRADNSLGALTVSPLLESAAQSKANDMAAKGYFAHNSPEGKTPWYWIKQTGYTYSYAGENLAINFYDSKDVVDAWMKSPEHRANILNTHFTQIGIATAVGEYNGAQAVFVVEEFGNPTNASAVVTKTKSTSTTPVSSVAITKTSSTTATTSLLAVAGRSTTTPTTAGQVKGESTDNSQTSAVKDSDPTQPVVDITPVEQEGDPGNNSLLVKAVANPRETANTLYMVFAGFITLALLIAFAMREYKYHPHMLYRGALFVAVLLIIIEFNYQFSSFFGLII